LPAAHDGGEPSPGGPVFKNGTLYGTTLYGGGFSVGGTVYAINAYTGEQKTLWGFYSNQDANSPNGPLVMVGNVVYGTSQFGGMYGHGTIFSLNVTTNEEHVLYSFANGTDGGTPEGGLAHVKGMFYGTTSTGGSNNFGTVFAFTLP
jgi:uncharacterized repeat protein (TIGR03803 family)